jgi:hypothetical protein
VINPYTPGAITFFMSDYSLTTQGILTDFACQSASALCFKVIKSGLKMSGAKPNASLALSTSFAPAAK